MGPVDNPERPGTLITAYIAKGQVFNSIITPGTAASTPTEIRPFEEGGLRGWRLGESGTQQVLGVGMKKPVGLTTIEPGPPDRQWTLTTPELSCAMPSDLAVRVLPPGEPWAFELSKSMDSSAMVFVRGPHPASAFPALAEFVGPGQTRVAGDLKAEPPWIEVEYKADGEVWRQRHVLLTLDPQHRALVSAQTPRGSIEQFYGAAQILANSLRLR